MKSGLLESIFNTKASDAVNSGDDTTLRSIIIATIANISDGLAIIDNKGIIELFNNAAERLTGWSREQATGLDYRSIFRLLDSAERAIDDNDNPINQALSTMHSSSIRAVYILTASRKKLQVSLTALPIVSSKNSTSSLQKLVIIFRDITREVAEQGAQSDFISTASHEMRTPVATLEGYLGMLLNPNICTIDDRAREYAEKSHKTILHLGRLLRDLLDVTKADDNRISLNPVLVDATIAVKNLASEFSKQALDKGLSLTVNGQPVNFGSNMPPSRGINLAPPSIIYVDLDRLEEILGNLVENAIKYTSKGGVDISIENINNRIRISVKDTGIGIPAEDVPHLFQKFYRVDNSETREIGGTGLGLYLIRKITTIMGGTVGVESDYGAGSVFWIEFDNLTRDQIIARARDIKNRAHRP